VKKRYIPLLLVFFLILILSISPVKASYVYFTAGCNSYTNWTRTDGNATWNIHTGDYHNGTASFDIYAINPQAGVYNPSSAIIIKHDVAFPTTTNYTYILGFWIKILQLDYSTEYGHYPFVAVDQNIGGVGIVKSGSGIKFINVYYGAYGYQGGVNSSSTFNFNTWYKVECNITANYGFKVYVDGNLEITDLTNLPPNIQPTKILVEETFPSDYSGVASFRVDTIFLADSLGLDPSEPSEEEGPPPEEGPDYTPIINLTVPFLFLFVVPMILATAIGKVGFIVGLCIAVTCLYMVGWMPLWAVFLIGLGIILLLLSGRSGLNE